MPKHPNVTVQLTGEDGNAFVIVSRVRRALKAGGVPSSDIEQFTADATSGDYAHVLNTCTEWVTVQ